jgi:hypothetical protein
VEVDARWKEDEVAHVLRKAEDLERMSDWSGAHGAYQEAERLVPSHPRVVEGLRRTDEKSELAAKLRLYRAEIQKQLDSGETEKALVIAAELARISDDPEDNTLVGRVREEQRKRNLPVEVEIQPEGALEMNIVGVTAGFAPASRLQVSLAPGDYRWTTRLPERAQREGWFSVRPGSGRLVIVLK